MILNLTTDGVSGRLGGLEIEADNRNRFSVTLIVLNYAPVISIH